MSRDTNAEQIFRNLTKTMHPIRHLEFLTTYDVLTLRMVFFGFTVIKTIITEASIRGLSPIGQFPHKLLPFYVKKWAPS